VTKLRDLGEFEVIRLLTAARGTAGAGVVIGPGDDAAVVRPRAGEDLAVTVDSFVEGRHYRADWIAPEVLGARLAEANLSDLAAMAARPRWGVLSYGLDAAHDVDALLAFQRGAVNALARHGALLVGGNLTAVAGPEWTSLTLIGGVRKRRAWTRAGARVGDLVAVTGHPGRAGAAVRLALRSGAKALGPAHRALADAWRAPRAHVELALALAAAGGVTAAVDLSDGIAGDLAHVCEASGVGAALELGAFPRDAALARAAKALGLAAESLRLGPSDDYELALAIDPKRRKSCEKIARSLGVPLTIVGRFTKAPAGLIARDASGRTRALRDIAAAGFDHFRPR
jgi:thiamine-monophosphate kinase